jgi:hypothetical protein
MHHRGLDTRQGERKEKGDSLPQLASYPMSRLLLLLLLLLCLCLWSNLKQRLLHPHPRLRVPAFRMHPAALSFSRWSPAFAIRGVVQIQFQDS